MRRITRVSLPKHRASDGGLVRFAIASLWSSRSDPRQLFVIFPWTTERPSLLSRSHANQLLNPLHSTEVPVASFKLEIWPPALTFPYHLIQPSTMSYGLSFLNPACFYSLLIFYATISAGLLPTSPASSSL